MGAKRVLGPRLTIDSVQTENPTGFMSVVQTQTRDPIGQEMVLFVLYILKEVSILVDSIYLNPKKEPQFMRKKNKIKKKNQTLKKDAYLYYYF